MRTLKLSDMKGGWFVGAFSPSAISTSEFEVGVKQYKAGDKEPSHYHAVATELTLVLEGTVVMFGEVFSSGTIIIIEPLESTDFQALTDVTTVVVKLPSLVGDKYFTEMDS
jgi:hypothetical protein